MFEELKKRGQLLTDESNQILSRTLTVWFVASACLTFLAVEYGWDSRNSAVCETIVALFPVIETTTSFTLHPKALRILWIWMFVTSPLVLTILLVRIRRVRPVAKGELVLFSYLFALALGLLFIGISPETGNALSVGFRETLLGGLFVTFAVYAGGVLSLCFVLLYFLE